MHYTSDKKILQLIDILKSQGSIRFDKQFCETTDILPQNLRNVRAELKHFTPQHIENIIKGYKVNANWIFGISDKIFLEATPSITNSKSKITEEDKS